jgi:hypothetical protein
VGGGCGRHHDMLGGVLGAGGGSGSGLDLYPGRYWELATRGAGRV